MSSSLVRMVLSGLLQRQIINYLKLILVSAIEYELWSLDQCHLLTYIHFDLETCLRHEYNW